MSTPKPIQIHLVLMPDGTMQISGPTENRLLFLGMLELARDSVNQHHAESQRRIIPAAVMPAMETR